MPRVLQARGLGYDDTFISVVPLGGRHVNHFWRLLHDLDIPHFTLLDLDLGRYRGGWGRVKYALKQLLIFSGKKLKLKAEDLTDFPKWDNEEALLTSKVGRKWIDFLESAGVFFSSPLDLDFAMLQSFSDEYGVDEGESKILTKKQLSRFLGKNTTISISIAKRSNRFFRHTTNVFNWAASRRPTRSASQY